MTIILYDYFMYTNIDALLPVLWILIICALVWFVWQSTVDGLAIKRHRILKQKIKDEEYIKYKKYYESSKQKKRKKNK